MSAARCGSGTSRCANCRSADVHEIQYALLAGRIDFVEWTIPAESVLIERVAVTGVHAVGLKAEVCRVGVVCQCIVEHAEPANVCALEGRATRVLADSRVVESRPLGVAVRAPSKDRSSQRFPGESGPSTDAQPIPVTSSKCRASVASPTGTTAGARSRRARATLRPSQNWLHTGCSTTGGGVVAAGGAPCADASPNGMADNASTATTERVSRECMLAFKRITGFLTESDTVSCAG
jgi:hypothetical protein